MLGEMQRFPMRGDENVRPHPFDHVAQFGAARMPGYVHEMIAVGDHVHALCHQPVDDARHRLLVARNGAGGKDHAVAATQRDFRMLVLGDAGERGARLALAAGAKRQHLVRRQIAVGLHLAEILHAVEVTGLARHLHDPLHSPADHHDLAFGEPRRFGNGANAADMGGEGGNGDARRRGADELGKRFRHLSFGGRAALADGIGRIADQRQHALVAKRGEFRLIGRRPDQWRRVDFPVAGMHHRAERGADGERIRFRDRVRHIDEIDGEGPKARSVRSAARH